MKPSRAARKAYRAKWERFAALFLTTLRRHYQKTFCRPSRVRADVKAGRPRFQSIDQHLYFQKHWRRDYGLCLAWGERRWVKPPRGHKSDWAEPMRTLLGPKQWQASECWRGWPQK